MAVRVVQGFEVSHFTGRSVMVKAVLVGKKDDISAGDGDIADVLESLELHATAADTSPVTVAMRATEDAEHSTPYEFPVKSFDVKQDGIRIVIEGEISDIGIDVLGALGLHSSAEGEQRRVEITMQRPD